MVVIHSFVVIIVVAVVVAVPISAMLCSYFSLLAARVCVIPTENVVNAVHGTKNKHASTDIFSNNRLSAT